MNSEEFARHMTNEDQQKLLKYLPSVDVFKFPERLENLVRLKAHCSHVISLACALKFTMVDSFHLQPQKLI